MSEAAVLVAPPSPPAGMVRPGPGSGPPGESSPDSDFRTALDRHTGPPGPARDSASPATPADPNPPGVPGEGGSAPPPAGRVLPVAPTVVALQIPQFLGQSSPAADGSTPALDSLLAAARGATADIPARLPGQSWQGLSPTTGGAGWHLPQSWLAAATAGGDAMPGKDVFALLQRAGFGEAGSAPLPQPLAAGTPAAILVNSPVSAVPFESPAPVSQPTLLLPTHPSQPGWDQEVGSRLVWLVNQGTQEARLQLNPPQLGPLEVRIALNQDQASVHFTSHHALVREALDAALPRLREVFEAQGMVLVNVDVSRHSFADGRHGGASGQAGGTSTDPLVDGLETEAGIGTVMPTAGGRRLLDVFV